MATQARIIHRLLHRLIQLSHTPHSEPQSGEFSRAIVAEHVESALRFAVPAIDEQFTLDQWTKHLEQLIHRAIRVFYVPLPTGIFGFRFIYQDTHGESSDHATEVIAINSNLSPLIQTTTLAHELAHTAFRDPTLQVEDGAYACLLRGMLNLRATGNDLEQEKAKRFQDFRAEYLARIVLTQMWVAQQRLNQFSTDREFGAMLEKFVD